MTFQADSGGHIVAFVSGLPNFGPHSVKQHDETVVLGTGKEHFLFRAQDDAWKALGEEMAERGIGVTLFAFSEQHCDLATIGIDATTETRSSVC